jgi:hypothetical protein
MPGDSRRFASKLPSSLDGTWFAFAQEAWSSLLAFPTYACHKTSSCPTQDGEAKLTSVPSLDAAMKKRPRQPCPSQAALRFTPLMVRLKVLPQPVSQSCIAIRQSHIFTIHALCREAPLHGAEHCISYGTRHITSYSRSFWSCMAMLPSDGAGTHCTRSVGTAYEILIQETWERFHYRGQ